MSKRAIITGITGQDGSYLAELLLGKGYEVFGVVRRLSAPNVWRIEHLLGKVTLLQADLLDQLSLVRAVDAVRPHEFYSLAAMSFVPASWDQPMLTGEFNSQGSRAVSRPFARSTPASASTRPRPVRCSARCGRCPRAKTRLSTPQPLRRVEGLRHYITVNYRGATASTRARGSCSTTSRPGAGSSSSRARSPTVSRASAWPDRPL